MFLRQTTIHQSEPRLVVRRNLANEWLWLLETADRHVVNRSDVAFLTKTAALKDARVKGF